MIECVSSQFDPPLCSQTSDVLKWMVFVGGLLAALIVISNLTSVADYRNFFVTPPAWTGFGKSVIYCDICDMAKQHSCPPHCRHPGLPHFQMGSKPSLHLGEHLIIEVWYELEPAHLHHCLQGIRK